MGAGQLIMDLTRPERSAQNIERSLRELSVGPVQRAVLIQLVLDPRCFTDIRGLETLKISQARAAKWIGQHVPCVGGQCHDTSVRKAWQFWADEGVLVISADRHGHTIKWHPKRIMQWHQKRLQEIEDSLPIFNPIGGGQSLDDYAAECTVESSADSGGDCMGKAMTGGDWSRPVVTGNDRSRPAMTGGDSQRREEEEDLNNSLPPPQSSEVPVELPNTPAEVAEIIRDLPELPVDVWNAKRSDSALFLTVQSWWSENALDGRCGDLGKEVAATVIGLLLAARAKNSPPAYYATCVRKGIRHHVTTNGRAWIEAQKRQRQGVAAVR